MSAALRSPEGFIGDGSCDPISEPLASESVRFSRFFRSVKMKFIQFYYELIDSY